MGATQCVDVHFIAREPALHATEASRLLEEVLSSARLTPDAEVRLDLSRVNRMTTGALALLLVLRDRLEHLGCALRLVPPTAQARALIALYRLEAKFGLD